MFHKWGRDTRTMLSIMSGFYMVYVIIFRFAIMCQVIRQIPACQYLNNSYYRVRTKRLYVHATTKESSCASCPCVLIFSPVMMCFYNERINQPGVFLKKSSPIARLSEKVRTPSIPPQLVFSTSCCFSWRKNRTRFSSWKNSRVVKPRAWIKRRSHCHLVKTNCMNQCGLLIFT